MCCLNFRRAQAWFTLRIDVVMHNSLMPMRDPIPVAAAGRNVDLDDKIRHMQIRLIYDQGPVLVLGATLCAVMVTVFLWQHLPRSSLLFWLGAVALTTLLRIWVIRIYMRVDEHAQQRTHWGPFFWLGTLSAGMIWGAWPLMFYSLYNTEHLLLISTVFAGMVAVSAASGSIYLPSFLSFSVPLVIPLAITHLFSGSEVLQLTGVLLIMFLGVNYFLAARGHRQYRELIRARFENQELLERLGAEKAIAERAVIAKSRFLAAASHDLRQPLHALGLFLSALRRREQNPGQLRIIDDMRQSSEALNGLFNSLLDVSRLDAEIIDFRPRHVPVRDLFDGVRAQFMQQAAEKGIDLSTVHSDCVLYTDVILLERVLRNLVSNAVQYTREGGVEMRCECAPDGGKIITLRDTGIGIPVTERDEVFSEYHQLNNPERDRSKGLGLGLAIVQRLCDLMDLNLSMDSEVGVGTKFRIQVPGGDPAQVHTPNETPLPSEAHGMRVLVIDDERQVLQSMRHMLEGWGATVMLAESARDALKAIALSSVAPDIVLSDYRLRENNNGVDAVATIRESLELNLPAVIITGDTSPERLKQVTRAGIEVMHKPVDPDELLVTLNRLVPQPDTQTVEFSAAGR